MTQPYATMQVPIVSSISIGLNFGQQIELGEVVNVEAVNDALYYGYMEKGKKKPPLFPDLKHLHHERNGIVFFKPVGHRFRKHRRSKRPE